MFHIKENIDKLLMPKAIIYDWDNTIVDSWPLIQKSIDKTMIAMGREPWGLEKVKNSVHKSMRESFPDIFGDRWQEAGQIYKNSYLDLHLEIDFLPNAKNLIESVAKADILQFIISNKMGPTLRQECQSLGVKDLFFSVIGAGDASSDKPSTSQVDLALIGTDLDPSKDEIWFIGDSIADIECAINSKCRPIIFGAEEGVISKSIPSSLIKEKSIISYFNHSDLIDVIKKIT
jgi:phosphoglycolate phosphatase